MVRSWSTEKLPAEAGSPAVSGERAAHDVLHLRDALLRAGAVRGLGDDAHDGLRVARARVHPRAVPVDADAVLRVDPLAGEVFLERLDDAVGVFPPALELRLHDLAQWDLRN